MLIPQGAGQGQLCTIKLCQGLGGLIEAAAGRSQRSEGSRAQALTAGMAQQVGVPVLIPGIPAQPGTAQALDQLGAAQIVGIRCAIHAKQGGPHHT